MKLTIILANLLYHRNPSIHVLYDSYLNGRLEEELEINGNSKIMRETEYKLF
jgi:hypothetical protein